MTKKIEFNPDYFRLRADGEPYRRYYVYITQTDGLVSHIEMCNPDPSQRPATIATCDLDAFLDVYRDGSGVLTINYEKTDHALYDFAEEYPSLTPVNPMRDDGMFFFKNPRQETHFYIVCGSKRA